MWGGWQSRARRGETFWWHHDVLKENPGAGVAGEAGIQTHDGGNGAHLLEGEWPAGEWAGAHAGRGGRTVDLRVWGWGGGRPRGSYRPWE